MPADGPLKYYRPAHAAEWDPDEELFYHNGRLLNGPTRITLDTF